MKRTYNPAVDPVFEIMGVDGSHVRIYADGSVTGYPVECAIMNSVSAIIHAAETACGRSLGSVFEKAPPQ